MLQFGYSQEAAEEFDKLHGRDTVCIGNQRFLYADGAICENVRGGRLIAPPADPHEKAEKIRLYWQEKLSRAVEEFTTYKTNLRIATRNAKNRSYPYPPPGRDAIDRLKALKATVLKLKKNLDIATRVVETVRPQEVVERERAANANRAACDAFEASLNEIEV